MSTQIYVKPARDDIEVRFPGNPSRVLSKNGEFVNDSIDWQRLVRFGDVTIVEQKDEQSDTTAKKGAK